MWNFSRSLRRREKISLGRCCCFGLWSMNHAQVLFTLAGALFNFGLVALHLAQDLFTLAGALFNFGLVCLAFSPGLVYFG